MTSLENTPPEVLEAFAAFNLFRCLGFEATNIDVGVIEHDGVAGTLVCQVHVFDRSPTIGLAGTHMTDELFQGHWVDLCNIIDTVSETALNEAWLNSVAFTYGFQILETLADEGIFWPNHDMWVGDKN